MIRYSHIGSGLGTYQASRKNLQIPCEPDIKHYTELHKKKKLEKNDRVN